MSQSDCADVQGKKEYTNIISRDKVSMAKLSMTVTELFLFYVLIVVRRFKFNSFIIILIIIKIELS